MVTAVGRYETTRLSTCQGERSALSKGIGAAGGAKGKRSRIIETRRVLSATQSPSPTCRRAKSSRLYRVMQVAVFSRATLGAWGSFVGNKWPSRNPEQGAGKNRYCAPQSTPWLAHPLTPLNTLTP